MTKVFLVIKVKIREEWRVMATRSTREKAEAVMKRAFSPDSLAPN
jgi:hypothetical protein